VVRARRATTRHLPRAAARFSGIPIRGGALWHHVRMTLEDFTRRLGTVLAASSLGVLVVALLVAAAGANATPEVATLHHLFGIALTVLGLVMLVVGLALASMVSAPRRPSHRGKSHQRAGVDEAHGTD